MKGKISFLVTSRMLLAGWTLGATATLLEAATFKVNTQLDSHNTGRNCAKGSGSCSLRSAIEENNARSAFPTQIIIIPRGVYKLTLEDQLEIKNNVIIRGARPDVTVIDGNNTSRVLMISPRSTATPGSPSIINISGITIQHGNSGIENGSGIYVKPMTAVSLDNSRVVDNINSVGGVGIMNNGVLDISRSTVCGNRSTGRGGGVTGAGGGIYSGRVSGQTTEPYLTITDSTISNNTAVRGGGIYIGSGTVDIINSTISGNIASIGGGIENFDVLNISFSTITNNVAGRVTAEPKERYSGGGIRNFGEFGGQVNIGNSILAGNSDGRLPSDPLFSPDCFSDQPFTFTSFRGNILGINTNCNMSDTIFDGTPFDQVGTKSDPLNPGLNGLSYYGGPTMTHALLSGSPAIDHGTGVTSATFFDCPTTDQRGGGRGGARGTGKACDVGAFEYVFWGR